MTSRPQRPPEASGAVGPSPPSIDSGCLVLSGIPGAADPASGGLYAVIDDRLVHLDQELSGGALFRDDVDLLRLGSGLGSDAQLQVYDEQGLRNGHRLDGVVESHDVTTEGEHIVVVSTGTNEVVWFDRAGQRSRTWRAPGAPADGDAWHLNNLLWHEGRLLVSAFGRFTSTRGWAAPTDAPTGEVIDTTTGDTVLSGLDRPHNPRFVDGRWWVCNSRTGELLRWRDDGSRESVHLGGWTRGLHFDADVVHVGVSAHRLAAAVGEGAELITVDRRTLAVLRRLPCPSPEIYDVVRVPWAVAAGVHAQALAGEVPLSGVRSRARLGEASAVTLVHRQPRLVLAGTRFSLACEVLADGLVGLPGEPPNPVAATYRWVPADGRPAEPWVEPLRTPLPRSLAPGERALVALAVRAPKRPGWYRFEPTTVHEGVGWFEPNAPGTSEPVAVVAG